LEVSLLFIFGATSILNGTEHVELIGLQSNCTHWLWR